MKMITFKQISVFLLPVLLGFLAIQILGEDTAGGNRSISSVKQPKTFLCSLKASRVGNHVALLEQRRLSKEDLKSTTNGEKGIYFDIENAAGVSLFWDKEKYTVDYGFEDSSEVTIKKFDSLPFQVAIKFNVEVDVNGEFKPADKFVLSCETIRSPHL